MYSTSYSESNGTKISLSLYVTNLNLIHQNDTVRKSTSIHTFHTLSWIFMKLMLANRLSADISHEYKTTPLFEMVTWPHRPIRIIVTNESRMLKGILPQNTSILHLYKNKMRYICNFACNLSYHDEGIYIGLTP